MIPTMVPKLANIGNETDVHSNIRRKVITDPLGLVIVLDDHLALRLIVRWVFGIAHIPKWSLDEKLTTNGCVESGEISNRWEA